MIEYTFPYGQNYYQMKILSALTLNNGIELILTISLNSRKIVIFRFFLFQMKKFFGRMNYSIEPQALQSLNTT